jgi:hypothetical protein
MAAESTPIPRWAMTHPATVAHRAQLLREGFNSWAIARRTAAWVRAQMATGKLAPPASSDL